MVAALLNYKTLTPGTNEYGRAFEHFILQECWAYAHYSQKDFPVAFWRTASGSEVDLILGDAEVAVEIKSSEHAEVRTKGLHLFNEAFKCKKSMIVSRDKLPKKINSSTTILPWQHFCEKLWSGDII